MPIHAHVLKPAQTRAEWMQQVATFSSTLLTALPDIDDPGYNAESGALLEATVISEAGALTLHA